MAYENIPEDLLNHIDLRDFPDFELYPLEAAPQSDGRNWIGDQSDLNDQLDQLFQNQPESFTFGITNKDVTVSGM
jgi:hypothetical protein